VNRYLCRRAFSARSKPPTARSTSSFTQTGVTRKPRITPTRTKWALGSSAMRPRNRGCRGEPSFDRAEGVR